MTILKLFNCGEGDIATFTTNVPSNTRSRAPQRRLDLVGRGDQLIRLSQRERLARLRQHLVDEGIELVAGGGLEPGIGRVEGVKDILQFGVEAVCNPLFDVEALHQGDQLYNLVRRPFDDHVKARRGAVAGGIGRRAGDGSRPHRKCRTRCRCAAHRWIGVDGIGRHHDIAHHRSGRAGRIDREIRRHSQDRGRSIHHMHDKGGRRGRIAMGIDSAARHRGIA